MKALRSRFSEQLQVEYLPLFLILGLATFLRLSGFMGILRGDDAAYYLLAHQFANNEFLPTDWGGLKRIGLYLPASFLIRLFGAGEFVAVLFPLLASLLTLLFVYLIAKMVSGKTSGLISALLWAVFAPDVFLATQLMPDGPVGMTTTGAVYFFLCALQNRSWVSRILHFALSLAFVIWSFNVKESTLSICFVLLALAVLSQWPWLAKRAKRLWPKKVSRQKRLLAAFVLLGLVLLAFLLSIQPWAILPNSLELTSFDVTSLWMLGRNNPIQVSDLGFGYWVVDRPVFDPPLQLEALTVPTLDQQLLIFEAIIPLFLVSALFAILSKNKEARIPLLWFFVLLFYLEWGTFPQGFGFPTALIYVPVTHWIDPRNLHIFAPPMVMVIGIFLSRFFPRSLPLLVLLAGGGLVIFAGLAIQSSLEPQILWLISLAMLICLFGSGLLALASSARSGPWGHRLAGVVLAATMLAFLTPVPNFSVTDYGKEQARRENLREVLSFLETQPALPISGDGSIDWLDTYSDFELGYDHINQGLGYPVGRMTNDVSVLERGGGFRLFYGCGQPVTAFEDWPLQVFGNDLGPKTCVSLVRVFPKSVLAQELSQARRAAEAAPTRDNIDLYLAISMQMQDMAEAVRALSMYVTYFPEQAPIVEASALFADLAAEQPAEARTDILAAYADCQPACDWEFSKFLTPELITAEGASYLSVGIDRKTDEIQSIQLPLQLNSATAYVLELELRSFAPFDLARFAGEQIPDSYLDSWNRATDWTTFQILFVTPQWAEASRQVEFELARVFDRGGIDLRRILLVEIGAAYD